MNGKKIIVAVIILCILGGAAAAFIHFENYEGVYYTRVDNSNTKELAGSSDMKYAYSLDCYSETGSKKELKFKTYKILREDAYLKLEVRVLGVHKWEEVQFDELPRKVQEKLNK